MKRAFLSLVLLSYSAFSFGQTYESCLRSFQDNKYNEAIAGLKQLQSVGGDTKDVSLLLSVIYYDLRNYPDAFDAFTKFYEQSENANPYLYIELNRLVFDIKQKKVLAFLEKALNDPKVNSTIKLMIIDKLSLGYELKGDFAGVRELHKNIGDVGNWSTVNVFENVSASGFNKDFKFLQHPEKDYVFTNKLGADVKWFDIKTVRNDHWIDFDFYSSPDNAIIASQTFIESSEDKEVLLKIGVSGSVKVWVNDYQVINEEEERNTNADVYTCQIKLQKGTNRLLVQTGSSEIEKNNFLVRLFDLNDKLITDISSHADYRPYAKAAPYEVKHVPFFVEKYFEDVATTPGRNKFVNDLLQFSVYFANDKKDQAYQVLKQLKQDFPRTTCVSEKAIALSAEDNNTIVNSKEKESIIANDPDHPSALVLKYQQAIEKEKWDDANTINEKYITLYGANETTETRKIYLLSKKKDVEKLVKETDEAYAKYPDAYVITEQKYSVVLNTSKDVKKANAILADYADQHFNSDVVKKIKDNYFKIGDKEKGKKCWNTLFDYSPVAVGWFRTYAEQLYEMKDYNEAMEMVDKAIAICPYSGYQYTIKSKIYEAQGRKDDAIAMLKLDRKYRPNDFKTRKKLSELEGKKDLSAYFVDNDITKLCADGRADTGNANDDVVCLLNDKKVIVYEGRGSTAEQSEQLYLVKSARGIDGIKEVDLPYYSNAQKLLIDKAEIIKKDGSKVAAQRNKGRCVFSSIEIGDIVHIAYRIEDLYKGELAEHVWQNITYSSVYPQQLVRFSLMIPAEKKFNWKAVNMDLQPAIADMDGYKCYTWEKANIAKMVPEPGMSPKNVAQLVVSSIPDWSYIANWYSDLSNTKTKADYTVKDKVKELMNGNEQKTELEKARIIYDYIEDNYHYSSVPFLQTALTPQRAARTLSFKLGDCKDLATLFVSMAHEAGLRANLVLVSTRGNDDNSFALPTIAFNHCIAQLHSGGKSYLVELTNPYLSFATISSSLINADGLYIPESGAATDTAKLVKLNSMISAANINIRSADVAITDNKAVIHRRTLKVGAQAMEMRHRFKSLNEDEKQKVLSESINKEFSKSVTTTNIKFTGLDKLCDTGVIAYDLSIDNFCSTIAGMKVCKIPWTESLNLSAILSLDKRKYGVEMWPLNDAVKNKESITIIISAGKKLVEKPKDVLLSTPFMSYSIKYTVTGNKIVAVRDMQYLKEDILPSEYAAVKAMAAKMEEADNKEIAFK